MTPGKARERHCARLILRSEMGSAASGGGAGEAATARPDAGGTMGALEPFNLLEPDFPTMFKGRMLPPWMNAGV